MGYTIPEQRLKGYLGHLIDLPEENLIKALHPDNWIKFPTVHEIKKYCNQGKSLEDECQEIFWHLRDNHKTLSRLDLPDDVLSVVRAMGGRSCREGSFGMWAADQERFMEREFVKRLIRARSTSPIALRLEAAASE